MTEFEKQLVDKALDYSNRFTLTDLSKKQIVMTWMSGALWVVGMIMRHRAKLSLKQWETAFRNAGTAMGFEIEPHE